MNKTLMFLLTAVVLFLAGCSAVPGTAQALKNTPHTAREYYNSDQLREATLDSCSAESEAELDANTKLPACKAAMLAQKHRDLGLGVPN